MAQLVRKIILKISKHKDFSAEMEQLAVKFLEPRPERMLLNALLNTCLTNNNHVALRNIISYWASQNPEQDRYPIQTDLFRMTGFPIRLYRYIVKHVKDFDLEDYITSLDNFPMDDESRAGCDKICQVFYERMDPILFSNNLRDLKHRLNGPLQEWLNYWINEAAPIKAPVPSWILAMDEDPVPYHHQLLEGQDSKIKQDPRLNIESIVGQLEDDTYNTIKEILETFIPDVGRLGPLISKKKLPNQKVVTAQKIQSHDDSEIETAPTTHGKAAIIKNFYESQLTDDIDLFRILGPNRPYDREVDLNSESQDPCIRYG